MKRIFLTVVVLGIVFHSCTKGELAPKEYAEYLRDSKNGLHEVIINDPYKIDIQYKPAQYQAFLEIRNQTSPEKELFKKLTSSFENTIQFTLRISRTDSSSLIPKDTTEKAYRLQDYFTYFMKEHISFRTSKQTFPCQIYHHQQSFGISPYEEFLIGFEIPKNTRNEEYIPSGTLVLKGGFIPDLDFEYQLERNDVKKIPQLKIK
jgi:hypothetical protein